MLRPSVLAALIAVALVTPAVAGVEKIDLTGTDVGSTDPNRFSVFPTANPTLFLGRNYGIRFRRVNFNTAPDGPLAEGGSVTTQYASLGVTMNDIRISGDIYGGNVYGAGFAAEDDAAQVYTFSTPVVAVGIVNTSPDKDLVQFYSGPNATGTQLFSFRDTEGLPLNFNTDRFVGGNATGDTTIGSFVVNNQGGNLELDELIFAVDAIPGDTDVDRDVDFADLLTLAQNYGITTGRLWETGDFDFDGATDFSDLLALAQNYGAPNVFASDWALAQAMVPEPAIALSVLAAAVAGRRRRSRAPDQNI